jgi:hypothetical protein
MLSGWRRSLLIASVAACAVAACSDAPVPSRVVVPLDLQVRNSGLIPGGFVWLSTADEPDENRWHRLGQAEFVCVTCPIPLGPASGYEIAVLDASCRVQATYAVDGGALLVEIGPGPTIRLIPAPPLGDWMPGDSGPEDPARIPCSPP